MPTFDAQSFSPLAFNTPALSGGSASNPLLVPHLSHLTQAVLNTFDPTDQRIRRNLASIDAQLLNVPAQALEDLKLRVDREQARNLMAVPTNLDNRGVYFGVPVPASIVLDPDNPMLGSVTATLMGDNVEVPFTVFDDRLPIPSDIVLDPLRSSIPLTTPQLFSAAGPSDLLSFDTLTLDLPNQLTFWVEGAQTGVSYITVHIEGEAAPRAAWADRRVKTDEILRLTRSGSFTTLKRWSVIDRIRIRGLARGETIQCFELPLDMPGVADLERPYTLYSSRGLEYQRQWSVGSNPHQVLEGYVSDFAGLELIQTYASYAPVLAVAVEPWTYGLLVLTTNGIVYADRREKMPDHLAASGLRVEPAYGLQVSQDLVLSTPGTQYVQMEPIAYANSSYAIRHRYTVQLPSGSLYTLDDQSNLVPYDQLVGWRSTAPVSVSLPVLEQGTYIFSIECIDTLVGQTYDSRPWLAAQLVPLKVLDISQVAAPVQDLCYDSWGQLWLWTGDYLVPVSLLYQGYILDAAQRQIYLTQEVSGVVIR